MADSVEQLRDALAGRYAIDHEVGRGGNAVVYLAHDIKHDRKVALKVLLPELSLAVRAERFLREIQIAARLTHPHILPLHDSGEANGTLYYVMPYVDGESLRERLVREKQLPVDDVRRITRDVAEALGYAHSRGVIHRDVKPENIMLSEGGAIVADFGIARALTAATGQVTEIGIAVGTPAYMSPEQGAASGELDARSDLYSLGCVVYEMLAGHPPFTGSTAQEVLARHSLDPVPSLGSARPDVPQAMSEAVTRSLSKVPAARFATASQFLDALDVRVPMPVNRRRLVILAAGLAILTSAGGFAWHRWGGTLKGPPEHSVVVLPFVSLSSNEEDQSFADGMTIEVINRLNHVPQLEVPAPASSFAFKGKNVDLRELARRLNVAYVATGYVRRVGDGRIRLTANVVRAADERQVWSESYQREVRGVDDLAWLQNQVMAGIVTSLRVRLATRDSAQLQRGTQSLRAYELYLSGRANLGQRAREPVFRAIDYFSQAIAADSAYAYAYSGLADAYHMANRWQYLPENEAWPKANAATRRALALDSLLAEAHTSLARLQHTSPAGIQGVGMYPQDFETAEREYRRALELNPRYAQAHSWFSLLLGRDLPKRRPDSAIAQATEGRRLDPLSASANQNLALILAGNGHDEEAINVYLTAIELEPGFVGLHSQLSGIYARQGRPAEALEHAKVAVQLEPNILPSRLALANAYLADGKQEEALREFLVVDSLGGAQNLALSRAGQMHGLLGNAAEAKKIIVRLKRAPANTLFFWERLAVVYAGLGEKDSAFAALERARQAGFLFNRARANVYDPLRSDQRFTEFQRKLPPAPSR